MAWFEDQPELLRDVQEALLSYPELHLKRAGHRYIIIGDWLVAHEGFEIDSYRIKIVFPDDYPVRIPSVFEVGNKIPKSRERHLTPHLGWEACLFVSPARWEVWPIGSPFIELLAGAIHQFFLSQTYYRKNKKWPFGDYGHGAKGFLDYFKEKSGVKNRDRLGNFLDLLLMDKYTRSTKCYCPSKARLKNCHIDLIEDLKKNIDESDVLKAMKLIRPLNKRRYSFKKYF